MQLSEHFTLAELTVSEAAARQHLDNTPRGIDFENLKRTAAMLEKVRAIVGCPIRVTSGYRAPAVNAAVGGSKTSAHMKGLAADTNAVGLTPRQFAEKIAPHLKELGIDQLILEFGAWVHLGLTAGTPRYQVLTKDATHDYVPGLH